MPQALGIEGGGGEPGARGYRFTGRLLLICMTLLIRTVADEEVLKQLPADLIIPSDQLQIFDNTIGQGMIHTTVTYNNNNNIVL